MAPKSKAISSKKKTQKTKSTMTMQPKAISKKQTKSQILAYIANETGLSVKQVKEVFLVTSHLAKCHLMKKGSGEFSVPELAIKAVRKTKLATKARPGRNPLTGEEITIPAKPKRDVIKVRALKSLKNILT